MSRTNTEAPGSPAAHRDPAPAYDRLARWYDAYTRPMEAIGGSRRRRRLLAHARGRVLEVGVGTGINLDLYSDGTELTGIDISPRMLERARQRATDRDVNVALDIADVTALPYPNESFDTTTATCVFCSVDDPVAGLREMARVTKRDGQILLLEHVRPSSQWLGLLFDLLSPITRRAFGPEINRRTEQHVLTAGIRPLDIRPEGIWREIRAQPPTRP